MILVASISKLFKAIGPIERRNIQFNFCRNRRSVVKGSFCCHFRRKDIEDNVILTDQSLDRWARTELLHVLNEEKVETIHLCRLRHRPKTAKAIITQGLRKRLATINIVLDSIRFETFK